MFLHNIINMAGRRYNDLNIKHEIKYNFIEQFDNYNNIGITVYPLNININNYKKYSKYELGPLRGYISEDGIFKSGHPKHKDCFNYEKTREYIINNDIVMGYIPTFPFNNITVIDDDSYNKNNKIYDMDLLNTIKKEIEPDKNNLYQTTPGGGYHIIYQYNEGAINDTKFNGCIDRFSKNINGLNPPCIFTGLRSDGKYECNFKPQKSMSEEISNISKLPKTEVKNYWNYHSIKYDSDSMKYCGKSNNFKIQIDDDGDRILKALDIIKDNEKDFIVDDNKVWKCITSLLKELFLQTENENIKTKWDSWSKYGDKYEEQNNIKKWEEAGKYRINYNYIIEIANQQIKDEKEKLIKYRTTKEYKPLSDNWESIKVYQKYLNITYNKNKHLLAKSSVNTGKTTLFKKLLTDIGKQSITITNSKPLNLQIYNDLVEKYGEENVYLIDSNEISKKKDMIKNLIAKYNDKSHIILCINSIEKLKAIKDVIIWSNTLLFIDEFHSFIDFLYTVDSKVLKRRTAIITYIIEIVQKVSYGFYVDSQITDVENLFLQVCNINYDFYINSYKPFEGVKVKVLEKKNFNNYYAECSKHRENIMLCSNQKKVVQSYNKILQNKYKYKEADILCIYSDSKDNFTGKREDLDNILQFMISPSITTGVEYKKRCKVFCIVKGQITITAEQILQQIARARDAYEIIILYDGVVNEHIICSSLNNFKSMCNDENVFTEDVFKKEYAKIKDLNKYNIDENSFNHHNHNGILLNIKYNKNIMNSDLQNITLKLLADKGYDIQSDIINKDIILSDEHINFNKENVQIALNELDMNNINSFDNFIDKYHNDDINLLNNNEKKFINVKNMFEILNIDLLSLYRLKTNNNEQYIFIRDIIVNNNLKHHIVLCDFFKKDEIIKNEMTFIKQEELEYHYTNDIKNSIILIKKILFEYMNEIFVNNDITTFDYNDDCAYAKLEINFNEDYYQILKKINRSIKEIPKTKCELMDFIYFIFKTIFPNFLNKKLKNFRINKTSFGRKKSITINKDYLNKHLILLTYRIENGDDLKNKLYYKYDTTISNRLKELQIININNSGVSGNIKKYKINLLHNDDYEPDFNLRCSECNRNINICNQIHNSEETSMSNDNIRLKTNYKNLEVQIFDIKCSDDIVNNLFIIYLYGIDCNGNDILCKIQGFKPYFYVGNSENLSIKEFKELLKIKDTYKNLFSIELDNKYNYREYNKEPLQYFKIICNTTKILNIITKVISNNFKNRFKTFNLSITPVLQFIHKFNLKPSGWIKILSNDDIISVNDFKVLDKTDIAPFRILSYDIECYCKNHLAFPKARKDPIIQIGLTMNNINNIDNIEKYIITLGTCDDIDDVKVIQCQTEKELLYKFKELIGTLKPHILTGFNIYGFDNKYILDRCKENNIDDFFTNISEYNNFKSDMIKNNHKSQTTIAYEDSTEENDIFNLDKYVFHIEGIINLDLLQFFKDNDTERFDNYKLDTIAKQILNDSKDDLKPSELFKKYEGNSYDRSVIAKYCVQDCILVNKLIENRKIVIQNISISNVCKIPLSHMFSRGQNIRSLSLVSYFAGLENIILPDIDIVKSKESYEGAVVLEPKPNIYLDEPIIVLDYGSLYPSSMIEKNISPDTYISKITDDILNDTNVEINEIQLSKDDDTKIARFIKYKDGRLGIIPSILNNLLNERNNSKLEMKKYEKSSPNYGYYDSLQIAYKLTANSLYGQCGARTSQLYFKEAAEATTAIGRQRIYLAKEYVENNCDGEVIYGDTDSIFIKFKHLSKNNYNDSKELLKDSIAQGKLIETNIKEIMPNPQKLNYEKVLYPFVIFAKKRYIGNLYENDVDKFDLKSMGVVLKRRDNAKILKHIYGGLINIILQDKDIKKSVEFLESELHKLVNGEYDWDNFILSKKINSTYKKPESIAHKVLADRVNKRKNGNIFNGGDRIEYIFIVNDKAKLQGERIETKEFIIENSLKPDYKYYIMNQLMNPITDIYKLCYFDIPNNNKDIDYWDNEKIKLQADKKYKSDGDVDKKILKLKEKHIQLLLFGKYL